LFGDILGFPAKGSVVVGKGSVTSDGKDSSADPVKILLILFVKAFILHRTFIF
jgi:hypothetical protein